MRESYWADLVLVDLEKPTPVGKDGLLAKCGWSPFEGDVFEATVETTVVSGQIAWNKGQVVENARGQALQFRR